MNALSVCAGIGAMDLGLRLALGRSYRSVGYVERDAYAAAVLVARMEEALLDPAPIWDDISTFDGTYWRGCVDIVTAGFPCQPFSASGKRKHLDDERWIWPSIARVLGEVQPSLVFIENVPNLAAHGLRIVLRDLLELGFDAEWDCFSAEDVEAPHRRERLWLLAAHPGRRAARRLQQVAQSWGGSPTNIADQAPINAGDTTSPRREGEGVSRLEPRQPGWWKTPPGIPLLAHGAATNVDRLRCSGNSLVPGVAALAFVSLVQRLVSSE